MKLRLALGALLSLVLGARTDADRDLDEILDRSGPPASSRSAGFGVEGDRFYVWDEDRREAESWATELAGEPSADPQRSR